MRNTRKAFHRTGAIFCLSLAGLIAAPSAAAQETSENDQEGLETIVVTATQRNASLQSVPIQVAAFSEGMIEDAGIKSTSAFANMVPNVSLDESFTYLNSFVVVRGVTQINNADSPVAVIVDGVPQNSQKQLKMNLFDVERIEVLKGPQGGLYGRNAIGGAINIITKAPSDHFEGTLGASYGRGDAIDLTGAVSTPIGESTGLRLAGSYKQDDGRIRNSFTGEKADYVDYDWELRGKLTTEFSPSARLDVRASYRKFRAGAIYDSVVPTGRADDYRPPISNIMGETFGDIFDVSAKLDFDLGPATLSSITAYTELSENYRADLDFSNPVDKPGGFLGFGFQAGQGQDLGVKLTSQELRLTSDDKGAFRWILGAYYLHTDRTLLTRAFIDLNGSRDQIDNSAQIIVRLDETNDNDAYAIYANAEYDIGDQLTLSGALRYDRDDREQTDRVANAVRRTNFESVQPKATLTYKFTPNKLAYVTYSTGFRSGGFNAPTVRIPVYDAERLQNVEAGFKTSWANNRFILNGAVYSARSKNFQYFFVDALSASQIIGNIDRVNIWGVELEMQARVAKGLQLFASLGTTDTDIKRNANDPSTIGNHTPKSTTWQSNAGFQYEHDITSDLNLLVRLDYQHRGKKYWQVDNLDVQEPLDLFDVRVGIEHDRWGLYVTGRNITGEKFYADFNPRAFSGLDHVIAFRGQPATWTVEGKMKF